jgi:hypothetical protein
MSGIVIVTLINIPSLQIYGRNYSMPIGMSGKIILARARARAHTHTHTHTHTNTYVYMCLCVYLRFVFWSSFTSEGLINFQKSLMLGGR